MPGLSSSVSSSVSSCARRSSFSSSCSSGDPTSSSRCRIGSHGAPIVPMSVAHLSSGSSKPCFRHGTTTSRNAVLGRRGGRTAFVGNAGFEHLLHLRRQTRAHLYRLCAQRPEPLVPLDRCHGVRGRLGPEGELEPLDLDTLPDVGDAEAVAVCLLFAFRDPRHEAAVAAALRARHPGVHVVASHEIAPEFREYERASTTAADAYLAPVAA